MAEIQLGLTFDDVLLLPCLSSILPGETDPSSHLCEGISLRLPILSAPMDTVTEVDMAIAMAREGGMGVIHRNNRIEDQAAMVARVKRFENAVITKPITVERTMSLSCVRNIMHEDGFSGFPVVNAEGMLEGYFAAAEITGGADYYDFYDMGAGLNPGYMDNPIWTDTWSPNSYVSHAGADKSTEEWDELEKSIVGKLADDVVVGIRSEKVELVMKKSFA